jgi:carboxyl-terminal processing protease
LILGQVLADQEKPAGLSLAQQKKNLESFDVVWQTVRDKHWDPKLGGLDWQAVHDELKPQVEKATSMAEVRAVMAEMLKRLGQSHFGIIPAESLLAASEQGSGNHQAAAEHPSGAGVTGIDVRVVSNQALVVGVEADSAAAKAGVTPGWVIEKVGGEEMGSLFAKVREAYKGSTQLGFRLARAVANRLQGPIGGKVNAVFLDADNQEKSLEIPLAAQKGPVADLGIVTGVHVRFENRKLEGNIGYLELNTFFDPAGVMPQLEKAMNDFREANGIILDLRGNPGGLAAMGVGFGNWFVQSSNFKLGTMTMRNGEYHFILNPRSEPYLGPLAILVDCSSASTAEFLAGGLQDLKRASVFGTRTAGAALPSQITRLPNGDGFQCAIANYVSVGGQALEGRGVQPDQVVELNRAAVLAGRDPVIDAAVEWIKTQKK